MVTSRPLDTDGEIYRYRTFDALIGSRREIARQELYLALPEELNDPMEGRINLVFQEDAIVWHNLIRHFVRSFIYAIYCVTLSPFGRRADSDGARMLDVHNLGDIAETLEARAATLLNLENVMRLSELIANDLSKQCGEISSEDLVANLDDFHKYLLGECYAWQIVSDHLTALGVTQNQIDNYLERLYETLVESLLKANPR